MEVGLSALNDSHAVQSRAVLTVRTWLLPAEEKHLRSGKTEAQRRSIAATYAMRRWVTPEQRARMTRAYAAMLWKHRKERYVVLDRIVESLGYTACASDADVIEMLEALRPQSGETHKVSFQPSLKLRIAYTPTGLLDAKGLETALKRIKRRDRYAV